MKDSTFSKKKGLFYKKIHSSFQVFQRNDSVSGNQSESLSKIFVFMDLNFCNLKIDTIKFKVVRVPTFLF
ncbi:hypothetical protein E4412_06635 [Leptospira interrogans]|nr:hypothetical protein E4412_06635 [Leptospira interrogans]